MKATYLQGRYVLDQYEETERVVILTATQAKLVFQIYDKLGFQSIEKMED